MAHAQPFLDAPAARPGVTRFDLICGPGVIETSLDLVRGWARARALRPRGCRDLELLVRAAAGHGLRFRPRGLTIMVRWADVDRVRVDLHWYGGSDAAVPDGGDHDLEATVATLDAVATHWGLGGTRDGWAQWAFIDLE